MNLQDTYNYLKERYNITHSFSTFKKNAEAKGLAEDHLYLELIASVLFSMNKPIEGTAEIVAEVEALSAEEIMALEEHIRLLELRNETLEQRAADAEKDAEEANEWLKKANATNISNRQLIKSLRDKNNTLKALYETEVKDRQSLFKEGVRLNSELDKERKYSSAVDAKIEEIKAINKVFGLQQDEDFIEIKNLKQDRDDWKGVAIARRKDIDSKRITIGNLQRELQETHMSNEELKRDLNSLKHKSILSKIKKVFGKGV